MRLQLHRAIYRPDSFVLMPRYCANLKAIRYESKLKLQLHDAFYRLRFCSNSLTHILSLSNSHNNVASLQKNRGDKSHRVIVALIRFVSLPHSVTCNRDKSSMLQRNKSEA